MYTCTHVYMYTCLPYTCVHAYMHTIPVHMYTHTHVHMHTYTPVNIYTCIRVACKHIGIVLQLIWKIWEYDLNDIRTRLE